MADSRNIAVKLLFLGTSEFAAPSLEALHADNEIVGVVTQPDRARTRKGRSVPTPVKLCAEKLGLRLFQFDDVNAPAALAQLAPLGAELSVVVAFGQKLAAAFFKLTPGGAVNLHGSKLPAYRGAAPISRAIADGATFTGLTIFRITPKWDSGAIYAATEVEIGPDETAGELSERMARIGAELFKRTIRDFAEGRIKPVAQDHSRATYAPKLQKSDGLLRWNESCQTTYNRFRAVTPRPGAYGFWHGGRKPLRIRILKARAEPAVQDSPGRVAAVEPDSLVVACAEGGLRLMHLQPAGGRAMGVREFLNGHSIQVGQLFGPECP